MSTLSTSASLAGIRVLDLSRVLAGPWATQILGDFGADIIRYDALLGGANDFRTKPIDRVEFSARARNMLSLRQRQKYMANHVQELEFVSRSAPGRYAIGRSN